MITARREVFPSAGLKYSSTGSLTFFTASVPPMCGVFSAISGPSIFQSPGSWPCHSPSDQIFTVSSGAREAGFSWAMAVVVSKAASRRRSGCMAAMMHPSCSVASPLPSRSRRIPGIARLRLRSSMLA